MPFDGTGAPAYEQLDKLDRVIDILGSPSRWCKGSERNRRGQYCIRGALIAVDALPLLEPVILKSIHQVAGRHFRRIEEFNDHPRTTHGQVVAVLSHTRENLIAGGLGPAAPPAHFAPGFGGWVSRMVQRVFC